MFDIITNTQQVLPKLFPEKINNQINQPLPMAQEQIICSFIFFFFWGGYVLVVYFFTPPSFPLPLLLLFLYFSIRVKRF